MIEWIVIAILAIAVVWAHFRCAFLLDRIEFLERDMSLLHQRWYALRICGTDPEIFKKLDEIENT